MTRGPDFYEQVDGHLIHIINAHTDKIDGNKVFLLEQHREEALRARLAPGVRLYTGEDFNYAARIQLASATLPTV